MSRRDCMQLHDSRPWPMTRGSYVFHPRDGYCAERDHYGAPRDRSRPIVDLLGNPESDDSGSQTIMEA